MTNDAVSLTQALLPCPFCACLIHLDYDTKTGHFGPEGNHKPGCLFVSDDLREWCDANLAVEQWNTRLSAVAPGGAASVELREALEKIEEDNLSGSEAAEIARAALATSLPVDAETVRLREAMERIATSGSRSWPDGDSEQITHCVAIARRALAAPFHIGNGGEGGAQSKPWTDASPKPEFKDAIDKHVARQKATTAGKSGEDVVCPFCGGEVEWIKGADKIHPYRGVCKSCGSGTAHHGSFQACIDAWSRRSQHDDARLRALEEATNRIREKLSWHSYKPSSPQWSEVTTVEVDRADLIAMLSTIDDLALGAGEEK